jgi:hypothetical protein
MRADNAVIRGGQTFIPVLAELDYYRAEIEQVEAFAPLVPAHRVWVEQIGPPSGMSRRTGSGARSDSVLDAPPPAVPLSIQQAGRVTGRRLVRAVPDGHVRDLRAATEPYLSTEGTMCIRLCDEAQWYRWAIGGTVPNTEEVDASLLWAE